MVWPWLTSKYTLSVYIIEKERKKERKNSLTGVLFSRNSGGSAFTTWDVSDPTNLKLLQTINFKLTGPPTDPDRQDAPHPHEAVLDPSGKFLLVPDLGMDLIHLYSFDPSSLKLTSITPVSVKAGSGPRHLAFVVKGSKTFAYLVTELGNTIIGYEVTYPKGTIQLTEFFSIPSHGAGPAEPTSYAVSEVVLSVSPTPQNLNFTSSLQYPYYKENHPKLTRPPSARHKLPHRLFPRRKQLHHPRLRQPFQDHPLRPAHQLQDRPHHRRARAPPGRPRRRPVPAPVLHQPGGQPARRGPAGRRPSRLCRP